MTLDSKGDLAAAELAFYIPSFVLGVTVFARQGFAMSWFYLVTLSILRLVGASVVLYMETQNTYTTGLVETAAITSAAGTAPLLLVLLALVQRVNDGLRGGRGVPDSAFHAVHLVSLAGLVLAIIGGVRESENAPGSDGAAAGKKLFEAGALLFLAVYLGAALLALLTASRRRDARESEMRLVAATVAVLPLLLVRIILTVCVSFASPGSKFYFQDLNVWVEAFMMFLMEALAICIYLWAGLLTPKREPQQQPQVKIIREPNYAHGV